MKRLFVGIFTCLAVVFAITVPASATETDSADIRAEAVNIMSAIPDYSQFVADLEASPFPRESSVQDGQEVTVYTLPHGITYTVAKPVISTFISGGSNSYGVWVKFNATEQRMIASGGGAALAVAICAIPGVGWSLCAVTSGIIAAAVVYISERGVCPNQLLVYPFVPERNRCA